MTIQEIIENVNIYNEDLVVFAERIGGKFRPESKTILGHRAFLWVAPIYCV
jgi:hypothetical protein